MGIDFLCGTKSFGCGYSDWNYVRTQILLATFIYLEQKIKDDTIITENYTENAAINRHDFYTNVISVLITKIAAQLHMSLSCCLSVKLATKHTDDMCHQNLKQNIDHQQSAIQVYISLVSSEFKNVRHVFRS